MHNIDDIEIAKMLLDQRKKGILEIAKDPVTINEMAEQLKEKPSRLYYHVKKLEEAGLLQLVETRQHGNLIEKLYKANQGLINSGFTDSFLKNNHDTVMKQIINVLQPGLTLLEEDLKQGSESKKQIELTIHHSQLTGNEWALSHGRMVEAMKERDYSSKDAGNYPANELSEEELERKSKYVHFVLSYRLDDALEDE